MKSNHSFMNDPFPALTTFFLATYNQDVWLEFDSHEAIWENHIVFLTAPDNLERFKNELDELLKLPTHEIWMWYPMSHALDLDENSIVPFLRNVQNYVAAHSLSKTNQSCNTYDSENPA